jgi:hypothetical protein
VIKWVENATRTGQRRNLYTVLVEKLGERRPFENLGVDGRIIIKWMLKK